MLLLWILTAITNVVLGTKPEVFTSKGVLKGASLTSRDCREYYAFTGVPYAKPPLGNLRFREPQSADSWPGVFDARKPSPACLQNSGTNDFVGQEDCLYLNVYTPKLNASLPVLFYVHGGSWTFGSSGPAHMPRYFMDEDIVVVMINYRLGPLGFLSTEDKILPGNMGLKDMALALKWVKDEIKNFGGDPGLITAFGYSAGAASLHFLCSVPKTRDLLKGCISQSGAGGSHFSLRKPGFAKKAAEVIAGVVGCPTKVLVPCLQSVSAEKITAAEKHLRFWLDEPLVVFGPLLEPPRNSSILTNWPVNDSQFPWLMGICGDEGAGKAAFLVLNGNDSTFNDFTEHRQDYVQRMMNLENRDDVQKVVDRFFKNGVIPGIHKLYTEGYATYPMLKAAQEHIGPKYFYVFNYKSGPSMSEYQAKRKLNITGVEHGEDNKYYFDISHIYNPKDWPQEEDISLSKKLIKLLVHFAKYQTPNHTGFHPEWHSFGHQGHYLEIANNGLTMKHFKLMNEILNFWKYIK
nr:venom carboxylesterase-6-like isoform X1 [Halyomorpha halys]